MTIPSYSTGRVSIAAGASTVAAVSGGPLWLANVREGDWLAVPGHQLTLVLAVIADDQLVIPAWVGDAVVSSDYAVYENYSARDDQKSVKQDVFTIAAALNAEGFPWIVPSTRTDPDPSRGDEGQTAWQPSTGKQWHKEGGEWVYDGLFKALGSPSSYDNARTYSLNDVATSGGSSYVWINSTPGSGHAPPDATYWALLAAKGDTGPLSLKPIMSWVSGNNYSPGPPADYVTIGGSSYACATAHTAGTFATDLSAGKWTVVASKGADAPVYGGSSTTSITIGTGSKVFTTQSGLAYQNGARVRATSQADSSYWMEGVASYSGTTLTIVVDKTNNTGTGAYWVFNIAGQPGAGDLSSANNLSDLSNKDTSLNNLRGVAFGFAQTLTDANKSQARDNIGIDAGAVNLSANASLIASDNRKTLFLTGSFTINLDTAANLGAKFKVDIRNVGNGVWSIVPSSSQTINGVTPFRVYPGESFTLYCNGTTFYTIGTSSGLVLLDARSGSVSSHDFNRFDPLRFSHYVFNIFDIVFGATGTIGIRSSNDGGATFVSSTTYAYGTAGGFGTSVAASQTVPFDKWQLNINPGANNAGFSVGSEIKVYPGTNKGYSSYTAFTGAYGAEGSAREVMDYGNIGHVTNALRFYPVAGGAFDGTFKMYGLTK